MATHLFMDPAVAVVAAIPGTLKPPVAVPVVAPPAPPPTPTSSWTKADIQAWLADQDVPYTSTLTKDELLDLVADVLD
jgi:hypothetical protein